MTYVVTPDKEPEHTLCQHAACDKDAVAAIWTNQATDGTVRSTIQWDLTDAGIPPKKAQRLCIEDLNALISGMIEALTPGGRG